MVNIIFDISVYYRIIMGCCLSNPNHDEYQEPDSLRNNNSFEEGGSKRLVSDLKIKKGEAFK